MQKGNFQHGFNNIRVDVSLLSPIYLEELHSMGSELQRVAEEDIVLF